MLNKKCALLMIAHSSNILNSIRNVQHPMAPFSNHIYSTLHNMNGGVNSLLYNSFSFSRPHCKINPSNDPYILTRTQKRLRNCNNLIFQANVKWIHNTQICIPPNRIPSAVKPEPYFAAASSL